jgi:hypothetical protein
VQAALDAGEEPPEPDDQALADEEAAALDDTGEGGEEEEAEAEEGVDAEDALPPAGPYTFNQTEQGEEAEEDADEGEGEGEDDQADEVAVDNAKRRRKQFTYVARPREEPSEAALQAFDLARDGKVVDFALTLRLIRERANSARVATYGTAEQGNVDGENNC